MHSIACITLHLNYEELETLLAAVTVDIARSKNRRPCEHIGSEINGEIEPTKTLEDVVVYRPLNIYAQIFEAGVEKLPNGGKKLLCRLVFVHREFIDVWFHLTLP